MKHYLLVYKPYGMVSRFTPDRTMAEAVRTLRSLGSFPPDVYPVGRLDADSEGLLLLTNDRAVAHRLAHPAFGHPKTYLAQVEGIPDGAALQRIRQGGLLIQGVPARPAEVRMLESAPDLPDRGVPIRYRRTIPTSWLSVTVREGRNRLVRRLTAAAGHPTLRLVRVGLGPLTADGLWPGRWRRLSGTEVRRLRLSLGLPAS